MDNAVDIALFAETKQEAEMFTTSGGKCFQIYWTIFQPKQNQVHAYQPNPTQPC